MSINFFNRNKSQGLYGNNDIPGPMLKKADNEKIFLTTDKNWNHRKEHENRVKESGEKLFHQASLKYGKNPCLQTSYV